MVAQALAAQEQATHLKERVAEPEPDNNCLDKLGNVAKTHHTEIKSIQSKVSVSANSRLLAHARDAGEALQQAKPIWKQLRKRDKSSLCWEGKAEMESALSNFQQV